MRRKRSRLLVVDDDDSIRSTLQVALEEEGYEVRAEADGVTIEKVAERFRPDLAILDVRLPVGPDGYTIARRLRRTSSVPVLFLTAAADLEDRLEGFRAGGDDYLSKPFSVAEVIARVGALLRRAGVSQTSVWEVGDVVIDEQAAKVSRDGAPLELTHTELQLLITLARHPGQVLSKTQLLCQVWGFDAYDTNLVEVHMSSLRRKLEVHGPRIVQTVRALGYVLRT